MPRLRPGSLRWNVSFPMPCRRDSSPPNWNRTGMRWVLFNAPPGRSENGERGVASLPGREQDFDASIDTVLQYIEAGDCRRVHVMASLLPEVRTAGFISSSS